MTVKDKRIYWFLLSFTFI